MKNLITKGNIKFGLVILGLLSISNMLVTQVIDSWVNSEYSRWKCIERTPRTFFWNFKKSKFKDARIKMFFTVKKKEEKRDIPEGCCKNGEKCSQPKY